MPPDLPSTTQRPSSTPTVAVITMVRDESDMLPRWIDYYAGQVGIDSLVVIDDNTVDGSTKDLPCTTFRLPPATGGETFDDARVQFVNGIARGFLTYFDVVIYTDADEFLVPDPDRHDGLLGYLADRPNRTVTAPLAVNVVHHPHRETTLDPTRPLLTQRRFVKFVPGLCKPLLKRSPLPWKGAFHAIRAPFVIDTELWMLHLKYHDITSLRTVADHRNALHLGEGRGRPGSAWTLNSEELTSRLYSWVEAGNESGVPDLDPDELDLDGIVQRREGGFFRSEGFQLTAMEDNPLRQLPERFRHAL